MHKKWIFHKIFLVNVSKHFFQLFLSLSSDLCSPSEQSDLTKKENIFFSCQFMKPVEISNFDVEISFPTIMRYSGLNEPVYCIFVINSCLIFMNVFKQDEYVREGLEWESVDYVDNSTCLHLMVGKPTGMIWLLDEECR